MRASFLHTSAPPPRLHASSSLSAATTTPASPYAPPPYTSSSSSPSSSSPSDPQLGAVLYEPEPAKVTSHLNALLDGLQPPLSPELATRMVTHKGAISPNADAARSQHNAKLSFLGRRILRLYLSIFYHAHASLLEQARDQRHANPNFPTPSSSTLASLKLCEAALEEALDSRALGRYVGSRWELEDNMVWRAMTGRDGRPTGLTKISGQAVEAIIGGVFRQYGAATALQVFNSRILPFLPLPQELRGPAVQLAKAHGDLSATAQEAVDAQAEGVKEE